MRLRTLFTYLSLLPLSACTKSCKEYDNNEEFARATLPAYSETGAGTLGCQLGGQVWTVLGSHEEKGGLGGAWVPNVLQVDGGYSVPPHVAATGEMTRVRDSKVLYDVIITLSIQPTDTLGGVHLLGTDPAGLPSPFQEGLVARDMLTANEYTSRARRPVRLLVRKLDRQQRIISGTFAGYLYGGSTGHDSLAVADGRFDLRY